VRELSLIREYETQLMEKESAELTAALSASAAVSQGVARLSRLLRTALRAQMGEDRAYVPAALRGRGEVAGGIGMGQGVEGPMHVGEGHGETGQAGGDFDEGEVDEEWVEAAVSEWALERECELARVEKENEELRRLIGMREQMKTAQMTEGEGLPDLRRWIRGGTGVGGAGSRVGTPPVQQ
jgi:hypothetical protein